MQYYDRPLSYFADVLCENRKRQLPDLISNLRKKKYTKIKKNKTNTPFKNTRKKIIKQTLHFVQQ